MTLTKRKPGRPAASDDQRRARGTYRKDRHGPARPAERKRRRLKFRRLSKAELRRLIRELPGYDPFRDEAGFEFDHKRANDALAFFPEQLVHIEGALAGKPFHLERWQQALVANLFGWVRWSAKWQRWVRRYRECLLYVGRKNGKTPFVAGLGLYELIEGDEAGQQNYAAASTRDQAGKLFRYAKAMVQANKEYFEERCRIYGGTAQAGQSKSIVKLPDETSFLQVIAAGADAQHGGTAHLILIDELHAQPNRELVDTLSTSLASENRAEPLLVMLTTADFDGPSICNEKHAYAKGVQDGSIPDAHFLPVIYEAERDADWTDERVWALANPNLDVSVSRDYLRRECKKAQAVAALENTFRRLHLNQKTQTDSRWLKAEAWDECAGEVAPERLAGAPCYAGLDLASTTDLAALALLFPLEEGRYAVLPYFWAPRELPHSREQRVRELIRGWATEGHITLTPGNVIDYDYIRADINKLAERYDIKKIAVDRWGAVETILKLKDAGLDAFPFGQGYESMNAPTKRLEALVLERKLMHFGNPVLRWMAGNVVVEQDAAGNYKPAKNRSTEKVDGIVALCMSLGVALKFHDGGQSVYETEELTVL